MAFSWFFPQETIDNKTPSRADGISLVVETRYRKDGARFVINAANTLKLRYDTVATGVVFYHRFFMMQSYKEFNRWVVAAACLLLAGKVEETPKQCKVILKLARSLLNDQQWAGFGTNPKEELITHERILLQTIKFDLQVEHPYGFLLKFAKELKGDKAKIEKIVQMAWTFVNDSLVTTLSIQWEPRAVAVAFIYLAGKLTKYDLQGHSSSKSRSWWRQFVDTLDAHDLDSICHQVLDTYGESGKDTSDDQQSDDEPISQSTNQPHPHAPPISTIPSLQIPGANGQVPSSHVTPILTQSDLTQSAHLIAGHAAPPISYSMMVPTTVTYLPTHVQTQAVQSAPLNNAHLQQAQSLSSYQSQPTAVGITTFALANPLQALQNIRTVSAVQQGNPPMQPGNPPVQYAGTALTAQPQQMYATQTLQANPLVPVTPGTQVVGGVYQQQTLQQYQQGVKVQGYPTQVKGQQYPLIPQAAAVQTPQQQVIGQQSYTGQVQSTLVNYPPVPGATQHTQNTVANSTLSRQAFSSPYHQSSMQSLNQRTTQITPNTKPQLTPLLPPQNTSYTNYASQSLPQTQTGLTYLTPGQMGQQSSSASTQRMGGASSQMSTQGHMIQGTGAQPFPPQLGGRGNLGHTPSRNKPGGGSGGWGMR